MKTADQIKETRDDMYRQAVILNQQGFEYAEYIVIMVRLLDWVLDDNDTMTGTEKMIALFEGFEKDKKKLALF